MKFFTKLLGAIFFLMMATSINVNAQNNGVFDVRFNMKDTNCVESHYLVVVEVKANSSAGIFNLSDQNYRFSFNKSAIRPYDFTEPESERSVQIDTMILTGLVFDGPDFSFYDPHTLTGSIDSIVSYNIVLSGGTGKLMSDTEWQQVGCLKFEFINPDICPQFKWHDSSPELFPPTFIGEKLGSTLYSAEEGTYNNYNEDCSYVPCKTGPLPIELVSFTGEEVDCNIELSWTTSSEIDNDRFLLKHSYTGTNFRTVTEIAGFGEGTSSTNLTYNFTDENIGQNNYYRLDQVDIDGTTTSSEVLLIKSRCYTGEISELYPNPIVKGNSLIKMKFVSDLNSDAQLMVTDVLGKQLGVESVRINQGPNLIEFDTQGLAAGAYFVQILGENWYTAPRKFVKLD